MNEHAYWLAFSLVQEIGPVRLAQLIKHFGTVTAAWNADDIQLRQAGLDGQALTNLLAKRKSLDINAELAKVHQTGSNLVTWQDTTYPDLLRELSDAPPLLYVLGELLPQDSMALAIVGTRNATHYGREVAFKLARQLTEYGITIVSGLAQGIDAAAHEGALAGGGRTIAVLGSGIDKIYPQDNLPLAQKIMKQGAIISEFSIGTPPTGSNFPRRNRVISGISLGVLIAEAPEKSGALITAECALEQGREVFAVPGNIFNPMGRGANRLIQDGAKLVMRVRDILDELHIAYENAQTQQYTQRIVPANDTEGLVLSYLGADPIHIDEVTRLSDLPIDVVTSTLTILELKGLAQRVGPMSYCRERH